MPSKILMCQPQTVQKDCSFLIGRLSNVVQSERSNLFVRRENHTYGYQTENLGEAIFVKIFGSAKQIFTEIGSVAL